MARNSKSKMNEIILMIKDMIKTNQDLMKLLKYTDVNIDIYNQADLTTRELRETCDKFIKESPMEFDDNKSACFIILMYGDKIYHHNNNIFFNGNTLELFIFCHNDIKVNDFIGDRTLEIESLIEEMFDNVKLDSIRCKTYLSNSRIVNSNHNYSGRNVQIMFSDWNEM